MYIIIIEGPDGSGKTTLAKQFIKQIPSLEYRHEGPPPADEDSLTYYSRVLDSFRGRDMVIDRFALGERVYGPILRDEDTLGDDGWRMFERVRRALNVTRIVCLPNPDVAWSNWANRAGEYFKGDARYLRSYARFAYFAQRYEFRTYDYEHENFAGIRLKVNPTLPPGAIGSPAARVLLIGDQIGSVTGPDLPFVCKRGSSAYLDRALQLTGISERQLALTNARCPDGSTRILPATNAWGIAWERVVALGAIAAQICEEQNMRYEQVPHPQYWKRFRYHDIKTYAELIEGKIKVWKE
jgi:hypothetical protein